MGRSWDRHDASLEDIKRARKSMLASYPNATDIYFDEYLVDTHQNESCNTNKFYYGAVMETKDGRFQAATAYGRIGEHLDSQRAFGGVMKNSFNEGVFTNFDSAKRKLNEKLDKKKRGKRCSKCKTRQSYSPFAPKNAEEYGAEAMSPQVFGKLVGQYPQPPNNPLPVGGFMDEGFEWTVNQAENEEFGAEYKGITYDIEQKGDMFKARIRYELEPFHGKTYHNIVTFTKGCTSKAHTDYLAKVLIDELKKVNGMTDSLPREVKEQFGLKHHDMKSEFGVECENCDEKITTKSPYKCVHHKICKVCVKEFGSCPMCDSNRNFNSSSNIVSKVKNNWLNSLIGLGVGLVAFDFLKKKGYVANADTLIESPNTGDLTPADYEEIVVESTGYAVPIIPVSLDGSFMGSRFHALPTDRYVYDSPEGIGANIDVAMSRNTNFLPNEQSLVQASEAPGQSPYNSILPNGQENKDFPLRVIHETTTVSLDPSTASYIPTDLSGYTGQQFVPTSVYEDMLGVGISGRIPSFSQPASGDIGSNHFGSRIANPDMLTNVGGPLKEDVNGDYTDGSTTKSLSQWSIENQVQQISDTEAIVVERGSGGRKMIRRV